MIKREFSYFLPTKIFFGPQYLDRLKGITAEFKNQKILLVAGEHLKKDGISKKIRRSLGRGCVVYERRIEKSSFKAIDKLTAFCRQKKPDLIIAIGGGTILDTAKSAAILANRKGLVKDYLVSKKRIVKLPGIPLVAIPTTSGTGSEVTPWATAWDLENKKKYSLASPLMFPKMAVVDPKLTISLPPKITASTGMDALSQAIEAYWSKNHNPVSDTLALKAISLILVHLKGAVNKPSIENREGMSLGSLFSGMAFSNTKTTICHSVSYPITAHFNIPHGQAVAFTLPLFLKHNLKVIGKKRREVLLQTIGEVSTQKASEKITRLMKQIGLETRFSQLGIFEKDLKLIVKEGFNPDRAIHSPWVPKPQELEKLLETIL